MSSIAAHGIRVVKRGREILGDVGLALAAGEFSALIGPNGAGKSTLLRVLAGLEIPTAGRVEVDGRNLEALRPAERARRLGYHPQQPELHWPLDVATVIALGRLPVAGRLEALAEDDHAAVRTAADWTGVTSLLARHADELSGGELARVHLARVLAGAPGVLLVDEPTANLDPRHQAAILACLRAQARGGVAVLAALHDLALAARACDRLILMSDGRIVSTGPPAAVLDAAALADVFGLPATYLEESGLDRALAEPRPAPPADHAWPGPTGQSYSYKESN